MIYCIVCAYLERRINRIELKIMNIKRDKVE